MPSLVLALEFAVGFVFAAAAFSKLRDPKTFVAVVQAHEIAPAGAASAVAVAVMGAEVLLAIAFIAGMFVGPAIIVSFALLASFTAVVGVNLKRHRSPPCGCFGSDASISRWTLVRIGLVGGLIAAVFAVRAVAQPATRVELASVLNSAAIAASFGAAAVCLAVLFRLARDLELIPGQSSRQNRSPRGL